MAFKELEGRNRKLIPASKKIIEEDNRKKRKRRVAAYCRVSTDSKEQETSYESQVEYYTDLIKDNPEWEFVGIYADPAVSGTSRRGRLEFDHMLYDCLHGKIDMIVTKSMSRFARNQLDSIAVIKMLKGLHPSVNVLFEDDHIESSDLSMEVVMTVFSMIAEQESTRKSSSVKWGFDRRREQGFYLTPTKNLLGYTKTECINKDDREMIIVEDEATIVKAIYVLFLAGIKVNEIAYALTQAGVMTRKKSTIWSSSSVLGILRNERYAGDVRTNKTYRVFSEHRTYKNNGDKEYVYEVDHHPAIVTHDEYEMAQKLIASHKYGYDPYVNGSYHLKVISDGLFRGFVPVNIHWAGSELEEYINLSNTIMSMKHELIKPKVLYFPGCEMVRTQDMSNANKATVRFSPRSMTLSAKCLEIMDSEYVEILFNASEKLIAIRASEEDRPGAVRWKRILEDKYVVSPIGCGAFTKLVYELMGWTDLWNTSVIAQVYSKNGQTVFVFDLTQFEINALPYKKPKPTKNRRENDIFYDIEAMIAQQIELLHQKQMKDLVIEEKPEEVELPPPKRQKFHQGNWFETFGEKSETVAVTGRRYQYEYLKEWDVDAEAVVVEGFDQQVVYTNEDVDEALTTMVAAMSK